MRVRNWYDSQDEDDEIDDEEFLRMYEDYIFNRLTYDGEEEN